MKKFLLFLATAGLCFSLHAQSPTGAVKSEGKADAKKENAAPAAKMKKDGTPDKRFKENKKLKKDGTPDKRYKENKDKGTPKK